MSFRFCDLDLRPDSSLEASGRAANERRCRNAQSRILAAVADLEAAKEIGVESEIGKGSTFTVRVPVEYRELL